MASFADWYNDRHRHSGIKFVTPHQRHSCQAIEMCVSVLSSMSRLASETHVAGRDPHAAGFSQKWFGSIHHQRKANSNQMR